MRIQYVESFIESTEMKSIICLTWTGTAASLYIFSVTITSRITRGLNCRNTRIIADREIVGFTNLLKGLDGAE
jgi:hypothetical protein